MCIFSFAFCKSGTTFHSFRRVRVCVCLVGFASLQSPWAHTLRHPCLACSSRCTEYCHSHNNCKKTIIPQKSPSHLPPLSKGGGLTARHKLLYCCVLLATHPPFLFTKLFCRQDGGIAFLLHPFRLSDTSVNNPSVTVTENTILCQRIFNFYKK